LRVIAIFILVLYHAALIGGSGTNNYLLKAFILVSQRSWIGTDFFLAVAGYLCVLSVFRRKKANSGYLNYLKDRAFRIIPSYYLFLFVYLSFGVPLINSFGQNFALNKGFGVSLWTFVSSFYFSNGKWSGVALEGMFSLSIVVQLFIIFGFILFSVKNNRKIILILAAFELLAIVLRFFWGTEDHWKTYFFTFTRIDAFIAGMTVAVLNEMKRGKIYLARNAKKIFYLSFILFTFMFIVTKGLAFGKLTTYLAYPITAIFAGAIINFTIYYKLKNRLLLIISRMGKFTYSIYLFKLPTVYLAYSILLTLFNGIDYSWKIVIFLFSAVAACFIVGFIWWGLVERVIAKLQNYLE